MGPLDGMTSVPIDGRHLVFTLQVGPHLAAWPTRSLGASNGAETRSPSTIHTTHI